VALVAAGVPLVAPLAASIFFFAASKEKRKKVRKSTQM
jgi:hypothetical protein